MFGFEIERILVLDINEDTYSAVLFGVDLIYVSLGTNN